MSQKKEQHSNLNNTNNKEILVKVKARIKEYKTKEQINIS